MRRLALFSLILTGAGCSRTSAPIPEASAELSSVVNVNDPRTQVQLVNGFFTLEANTWRWTAKKFTVVLAVPKDRAHARISLDYDLPEAVFRQVGPVSVRASVNGLLLDAQQAAEPGRHQYSQPVPEIALQGDAVAVEFSTDKALPPSDGDTRELALIAFGASLTNP